MGETLPLAVDNCCRTLGLRWFIYIQQICKYLYTLLSNSRYFNIDDYLNKILLKQFWAEPKYTDHIYSIGLRKMTNLLFKMLSKCNSCCAGCHLSTLYIPKVYLLDTTGCSCGPFVIGSITFFFTSLHKQWHTFSTQF